MKKLYTTRKYIKIHKRQCVSYDARRLASLKKRKIKRKIISNSPPLSTYIKKPTDFYGSARKKAENSIKLKAPKDFRLLENTSECLLFFREIRDKKNIQQVSVRKCVRISLKDVEMIDYVTISALTAVVNNLTLHHIDVNGNLPTNQYCAEYIRDSGFLDRMYQSGKKFPPSEKSEIFFFEQGAGKLHESDNKKISDLIEHVLTFLQPTEKVTTNVNRHIKSMILEICGNSIQWAGDDANQWLLGCKYEDDGCVIFTAIDVGEGILSTLYRRLNKMVGDFFNRTSPQEILEGAFDKRYGSATKEINRNQGLPSIKGFSDNGGIKNLKVMTNNVILHFDDKSKSCTLKKNSPRFKGTLYQWTMDVECIQKLAQLS